MKLSTLTLMLETWDLDGSVSFYTDTLGFKCDARSDDHGWVSLTRDNVSIMFSSPNQHMGHTAPTLTGSLYFKTDEVDSLWANYKDKARVCYAIENFDYGMREFAIFDNNGYLLQFGQPIEREIVRA